MSEATPTPVGIEKKGKFFDTSKTEAQKPLELPDSGNSTSADNSAALPSHRSFPDFPLRGDHVNPLADVCGTLIALVLHLRDVEVYEEEGVAALHKQVTESISAVSTELHEAAAYEPAIILSCTYCLCTFIDEAVLDKEWGRNSLWAKDSQLSLFHGETYGGEKFYHILAKLQTDTERYWDLIVLLYLFLCLGYRGQYGSDPNGERLREKLIRKLCAQMQQHYPEPTQLNDPTRYIVDRDFKVETLIPTWLIYGITAITLWLVYQYFDNALDTSTRHIIEQIQTFQSR